MREQFVRRSLAAALVAVGLCATTTVVSAQAAPSVCRGSSVGALHTVAATPASSTSATADACGSGRHVAPSDWTW